MPEITLNEIESVGLRLAQEKAQPFLAKANEILSEALDAVLTSRRIAINPETTQMVWGADGRPESLTWPDPPKEPDADGK